MDGTKPPSGIGIDSDSEGVFFYLNNKFALSGLISFILMFLFTLFILFVTILSFSLKFFQPMGTYFIAISLQFILAVFLYLIFFGLQVLNNTLKDMINNSEKLNKQYKKYFKPNFFKSNKGVSKDIKLIYKPSKTLLKAREKIVKDRDNGK